MGPKPYFDYYGPYSKPYPQSLPTRAGAAGAGLEAASQSRGLW